MPSIWTCKIGTENDLPLPRGSDQPMRIAVERAYFELTGQHAEFTFSGWGGTLTETEKAANAIWKEAGKQLEA